LKAKKQDMSIRELFRQKLGNVEIIPSASVHTKLMHKVAIREFLRFNAVRFNIYYLGGILAAGISAALILSAGSDSSQQTSNNLSGEKSKTDSIEYFNIPVELAVIQKPDTFKETANELNKINKIVKPSSDLKNEPVQRNVERENPIVAATQVNDSFSKKDLFPEASPDMSKLQQGFKGEEVLIEPSVSEGCSPLKVHFYIKSDSYDSCKWTFGDGGYSNEKNPEWIFDVDGDYKVVLHLFGSDGSQVNSSATITVHPKPMANFEIYPEKAILPEDEIHFYNYSTSAVNFNWDFGDGGSSVLFEPRHKYAKYGNYNIRLIVSSDYGCSDSIIVSNAFSGSEYFIDFPNAFIPNMQGPTGGYFSSKSDESAQVFHAVSSGVTNFHLKVFSKLGILIFESSDINLGWDGYFNGQLCEPGVYIWKVRGNFRNKEPFIKMGDVTLLRN